MADFFKITAGQVITWFALLFGAAGVWWKMRYQLDSMNERQAKFEAVVRELESKGVIMVLGQHEARLAKLEALQQTLSDMRTDIALIKQAMRIGEDGHIRQLH